MSVLIKNGRIITAVDDYYADIYIEGEKISLIGEELSVDADTVIDRADFSHPTEPAAGIETVFVNGQPVWRDGASTGARPGRALRRQQLANNQQE